MSYYAVKVGRIPGIYKTWEECKAQVHKFTNSESKKFENIKAAKKYMAANKPEEPKIIQLKPKQKQKELTPIVANENNPIYIYVDGSYNPETKKVGYGLIMVQNENVLFKDLGGFREDEFIIFKRATSGEIRGAIKAIEIAIANGYKEICIVYDFEGIETWATEELTTSNELANSYHDFVKSCSRYITINFKKVKSHASLSNGGDMWNRKADKLAKLATAI